VRLLLDTHAFLWANTEPERLGKHLSLVENPRTDLLVSAVVSWEVAIKYRLGRLPLPQEPERYVPTRLRALKAETVAIEHRHALAVAGLPLLHRDPFDRLLVAQASALDVPILTADDSIARYRVGTLLIEQ
jgi:PIN domain nuclease of toxin-antitoxin system